MEIRGPEVGESGNRKCAFVHESAIWATFLFSPFKRYESVTSAWWWKRKPQTLLPDLTIHKRLLSFYKQYPKGFYRYSYKLESCGISSKAFSKARIATLKWVRKGILFQPYHLLPQVGTGCNQEEKSNSWILSWDRKRRVEYMSNTPALGGSATWETVSVSPDVRCWLGTRISWVSGHHREPKRAQQFMTTSQNL